MSKTLTKEPENVKFSQDERIRRVRRRVEDYLRKAPGFEVMAVAVILRIQTD